MTTKNIISLLVVLLTAAVSSTSGVAFNITQILSKYPDFSSFNDFLSVTGLADEINIRQTITVLAVDNSGIDAVAGRPVEIVKRILSVHVILDYFDSAKLEKLSGKTALLTTLFQSSGVASNKAGFLNVTDMDDNMVSFGSAAPGSGIGANLVKEVFTKPYDLSILQVSDIIVPPGIQNLQPGSQTGTPPAAASPPPTTNAPPPTTTTTTTAPPPKTGTTTTAAAPAPKSGSTTTPAAPTPKSSTTTTSTPTPTAAPSKSSSPVAAPTKEATTSPPSKTAPAPTKPATAPTTSSSSSSSTTTTSPSVSPSSGNAVAPTAETPSATTAPSASTEAPTSGAPQASTPTSAVADSPASDAASPVPSDSGTRRLVAGATAATLAMAVIISAF